MNRTLIKITLFLFLAIAFANCKRSESPGNTEPQLLFSVGDSTLTLDYVVSRIPLGLSAEDSVRMFNNIVDFWLEERLLSELAEENVVDMEKIDKMVADYRRKLITMQFLENVRNDGEIKVSDDDIRNYYKNNAEEMRLETPIIKGLYVKVPEGAQRIDDVRKWVTDGSKESIDLLEKYGLREAMQYDFFGDKWVDWQLISEQIPYRFGDVDKFVASNKFFETTQNGSTYFLHIFKYLKTGDVIPLDFARNQIEEIITSNKQRELERKLIARIYNKGLKEGSIKIAGYNPVTHKMLTNEQKNQTK